MQIPCGKCIGCKMDKAKEWSIRCVHESMLYLNNIMVTLTYDDDKIPPHNSLRYSDIQKFLKRLRKKNKGCEEGPSGQYPIRYLAVGEYGDTTLRPHYHMLLFNFTFQDKTTWGEDWKSETLTQIWQHGQTQFSQATPARIAYVARYSLKKIYGPAADELLWSTDPETGEMVQREPERALMSRNPGLGYWWVDRYRGDYLGRDFMVLNGIKTAIPQYYQHKLKQIDELEHELANERRYQYAKKIPSEERTDERLRVKEDVHYAELRHRKLNKRGF